MSLQPPQTMERRCKNWISTYLKYTSGQESPEEFHTWVALSLLGAALGRRCELFQGYLDLFPNQYIVLTASSGIRKSAALKVGMKIFNMAFDEHNILTEKASTEALIKSMSSHYEIARESYAYIVADEFHRLIGKSKQDQAFISHLTEFYDCPDQTGQLTLARGLERCRDVCVNLLATSTPEWLRLALPSDVIGGGFTARIMFVYAESCDRRFALPKPPPGHKKMMVDLATDLAYIGTLKGDITMEDDAFAFYEHWYDTNDERDRAPYILSGYYQRKHAHMLKTAAGLSVAKSNSLRITLGDIQAAKVLIEKQEVFLPRIMALLKSNIIGEVNEQVFNIIKRNRELSHAELLRKVSHFLGAAELSAVIETLKEARKIEAQVEGTVLTYTAKKGMK